MRWGISPPGGDGGLGGALMLSDAKKRAILSLRKKGFGYKKIGAALKLSRDQVRDYLRTDAAKKALRNSKRK